MKHLVKIINIFLIIAAAGVLLWLVNMNFLRSRQIDIKAEFGQDQPMMTRLGPDARLKIENGQEMILADPVYFDLRSLPWFNKMRLKIVYLESNRLLNGIGPQTAAGWQYDIAKPISINHRSDGFVEAYYDFDLNKIYHKKNIRRFAISSSPSSSAAAGQIIIQSLNVTLYQ